MKAKSVILAVLFIIQGVNLKISAQTAPVNSVIAVPNEVVFADQVITLDRADLRERMDRELIAFTYTHSTSTLMIKRANKFFPQIEPILKRMGVPDDLKYLMVIESNLDPQAQSSAGAAGLWQFTQATGRAYGLEVNANIDERFNTVKATEAACRFLKEAYEKYGDWMTVAASYNGGQQGMDRRIEAQHQTDALNMWLVDETSRYMFRLLAVKMMFEDPSKFGFRFKREDLYPYIPIKEQIKITEPVDDLVAFAEKHNISYADLKRANLWLRESKLNNKSHRTYYIDIPDVNAQYYDPSQTKVHSQAWVK
ncbi:MAG: lytic transglycosylase domain-containing protein [Bacteroidaceae bacterium]|nr:lytic transglycosylase domain-containing protein [Bacteroidaceae bacterium]